MATDPNHVIFNCTFYGSDGTPIVLKADGTVIRNSLFAYNDWTGVGAGSAPGQ